LPVRGSGAERLIGGFGVQFTVGDKVVYPSQGVSIVESIGEEELAGMTVECYHLRLISTESKVVVPVTNADRVGLRPLSGEKDIKSSLARLKTKEADNDGDWKERYRANLDRIKTGDLDEVVDVLLCLADVAGKKTLSFRERKMFDHARQLLAHEVAEVRSLEVDTVQTEIDDILSEHMGVDLSDAAEE
jgi:CarD family transcriptional regulator